MSPWVPSLSYTNVAGSAPLHDAFKPLMNASSAVSAMMYVVNPPPKPRRAGGTVVSSSRTSSAERRIRRNDLPAWRFHTFKRLGISSRHGLHHVAHALTRTGAPVSL